MNLTEQGLRILAASPIVDHPRAHSHFWERAFSRRDFLAAAGLAGGAVVTSSSWMPVLGKASQAAPRPIPYGTMVGGQLFRFLPPQSNSDESSIYDFKGMVGVAEISGPGAGVHNGGPLAANAQFGSDNRFMTGVYVGTDGKQHHGTFGFI
jgi:hypothetical protein